MDVAQSLQSLYVHILTDVQTYTQTWYVHVVASISADEEALTFAHRPSWYSDTYPETGTKNRQLSVIMNIETDAQTV